ncbi:MAG: hypothetical protein IT317_01015 [Anaerolineales bacterium]|nr:hypothetical protein [Anaerolineales bacterium]
MELNNVVTGLVWLLLGVSGAAWLWAGGRAAQAIWPLSQASFTWRYSWRRLGWLPLAALVALLALYQFLARTQADPIFTQPRLIESLVPLLAAGHAAFLFSPEDEPALELTLTLPRPLTWLLAERLALLLGGYGALALAGSLLAAGLSGEALEVGLLRWSAPLVFLTAVALCVTLIGRQAALSVGVVGLLWFGLIYAGEGLVARWPFTWPLHLYLQPGAAHYALNRAWLVLGGAGLLLLALTYLVRDPERLLLGGRGASVRSRR